MVRFTLRDVFWLMLLAGLVMTWWREGINLDSEKRSIQEEIRHATTERDSALRRLRTNEPYYIAEGWHTIANPDEWEMRLDSEVRQSGQFSALLKGDSGTTAELIQAIQANDYRGKRVKFSAHLKTDSANVSLFISFSGIGEPIAYRDGRYKLVSGTTDWQRHELVLDIPGGAQLLSFGVVAGYGSTWLDDLSIETVKSRVPPTPLTAISSDFVPIAHRIPKNFPLPTKPLSLDFEH